MASVKKSARVELRADMKRTAALEALVKELRAELDEYRAADKLERQVERLQGRIMAARVHVEPLMGVGQPCSPLAEAVARALQGED